MMLPVVESIEIMRTERGLTVSGTRVALCSNSKFKIFVRLRV